jgi:ubiquinone/menaquinone biosynthesis C-methylase UbiE
MSGKGTTTRRSYDVIAPEFLARTRDRSKTSHWLDAFASALPPNALVLDVGGGPGFDAAELRQRGLRAVTLDYSMGMLRAGCAEFPGDRLRADMLKLPVADGSIDGIYANACLLHIERAKLDAVLAGFRRALLPGGVLHVSVKQGDGAGWERRRYGSGAPRWFTYWRAEPLDEVLARSGFRVIQRASRRGTEDSWLVRLARSAS